MKMIAKTSCSHYSKSCSVNEDGVLCYTELEAIREKLENSFNNCINTSTCSENCKVALQNMKSFAGCCINNVFNNSFDEIPGIPILAYKFWMLCGLETPGICQPNAAASVMLSKLALPLLLSVLITTQVFLCNDFDC